MNLNQLVYNVIANIYKIQLKESIQTHSVKFIVKIQHLYETTID